MTKTNLWITNSGRKIPVELLEDSHLRKAYKLCWLIVYFYEVQSKDMWVGKDIPAIAKSYGFVLDIDTAKRFSVVLEEEVLRRKRKWKRPIKDNLYSYLKQREESFDFLRTRYKNILNPNR